jgi:hypothetical protein
MVTPVRDRPGYSNAPLRYDSRSEPVRRRQMAFERREPEFYLTRAGRREALEIHQGRLDNAAFYLRQLPPSHWNAALEYRHGANCLEIMVFRPQRDRVTASIANRDCYDLLRMARNDRTESVKYLRLHFEAHRQDQGIRRELAIEVGHLAHVLTALGDNFPGEPDRFAEIVELRLEAARTFEDQMNHLAAFQEWNRLVVLYKKADNFIKGLAAAEEALKHAGQHKGQQPIPPYTLGQLRMDIRYFRRRLGLSNDQIA